MPPPLNNSNQKNALTKMKYFKFLPPPTDPEKKLLKIIKTTTTKIFQTNDA